MTVSNPIIWMDFPDPDVIRVNDTYYMISTTMHLMPGGVILRSYDLAHWEIVTYLYDNLEDSPGARLEDGKGIYSAGMWAATLRYNEGRFYVIFVSNDIRQQQKSFLFTSESINGPWEKTKIDGFYHDCSLLFDRGKPWIVSGNGQLWLTEMKKDLSGPEPDGIHKMIVNDTEGVTLRSEGSHLYYINGKYWLFAIHWLDHGTRRRTEVCYVADRIDGPYHGRDVLDDDMDYHNAGVAQGGIVDTPDGKWYAMLFQDHGAVGRIPVLVPVNWENEWPVFGIDGKVPHTLELESTHPDHIYEPLIQNDDFNYAPGETLKKCWQWNHIPDPEKWTLDERPGYMRLKTCGPVRDIQLARNMLGQRTAGPVCTAVVKMDCSGLKEGDQAGLCVMQGQYAWLGVKIKESHRILTYTTRDAGKKDLSSGTGRETEICELTSDTVFLKCMCSFEDNIDQARFSYRDGRSWKEINDVHQLAYRLDHFMGARLCIFAYASEQDGGYADFDSFNITVGETESLS